MEEGNMSDQSVAREYFGKSIALLQNSGFQLSLNFEMESWVSLMKSAPGMRVVNPTFDPGATSIPPGTALWASVFDSGGIGACIANRFVETENFIDEMATGRLWNLSEKDRETLSIRAEVGQLRSPGRVGHAGGLWIHQRLRKQGLSWLLPRLMRSLSILNWDVERHCGVVFNDLYNSGMPATSYGFPEGYPCLEGWFAPTGRNEMIHVVHIDREQIVSGLASDIELIDRGRHKHVRDVAIIVGEREKKPAVAANVG